MGFYVDVAEMKKSLEQYQKLSQNAQKQLNTAKNAMNGIITSNTMHGQVGKAINADINNNQNAVIVGLSDSFQSIEMELQKIYQAFISATGETSSNAIISEEVLVKAKSDIDKLKLEHKEKRRDIQSVYNSISDLISLDMPSSEFEQSCDEVKKYTDEIIRKVNEFDGKQSNSVTDEMIQSLNLQIKSAEKVAKLSYTDPKFVEFSSQAAFADSVQKYHKSVMASTEKQRKIKEKDLNGMTPSEMIAKYGVNDPLVKKQLNEVSNGVSSTAFGTLKDTTEYGGYVATGNLAWKEAVASGKKIKNGTWHGSSVKSTKTGFKTWKQVNGDVGRFKSVKGAKQADEILNGTGKIGSGLKGIGYLGATGAVFDGSTTYLERKDKYGTTSAAIDGTAHAATSVGAIYAGAAIGSAIPIPVVGTVVGALGGFIVGNVANAIWDKTMHPKDKNFFSSKTIFGD